jgi:hypothetical protein
MSYSAPYSPLRERQRRRLDATLAPPPRPPVCAPIAPLEAAARAAVRVVASRPATGPTANLPVTLTII